MPSGILVVIQQKDSVKIDVMSSSVAWVSGRTLDSPVIQILVLHLLRMGLSPSLNPGSVCSSRKMG